MADKETGGAVVPRAGQRVRIVRHEPEKDGYSSLDLWGPEFAVGTEHAVECVSGIEVILKEHEAPCLLLSEIEVLP